MYNYGYTFKTMCIIPLTLNDLLNFEHKHLYKGSVAKSQKSLHYCTHKMLFIKFVLVNSDLVPLHNACSYGHYEVAELLVKVGPVYVIHTFLSYLLSCSELVGFSQSDNYTPSVHFYSAWCLCQRYGPVAVHTFTRGSLKKQSGGLFTSAQLRRRPHLVQLPQQERHRSGPDRPAERAPGV